MPTVQQLPIIDWNDLAIEFLPTSHRTPRFIAWQQGMLGQNMWLNKNFWNYCYGDLVSNSWISTIGYSINDTVITYQGVYISTCGNNLGNSPDNPLYWIAGTYTSGNVVLYFDGNYYQVLVATTSNPPSSTDWGLLNFDPTTKTTSYCWYKIAPSYIGAQERAQYNSQKLIMEYALNRWFRTTFRQPTSYRDGTVAYTVNATSILGIWYLSAGGYNVSDIFITTVAVTYPTLLVADVKLGLVGDIPNFSVVSDSAISGSDTTYKFIVWIPTSLSVALGVSYVEIISSVVNKMLMAGTSYTVQVY